MCGIVGYIGNKNVKETLLDGLFNLEYRGYDSAGVCMTLENNTKIFKSVGKVKNLEKKLKEINSDFLCGIAHTRWATHGGVSETNSHPHRYNDVTLVHNGIIENYKDLGIDFNLVSQTDSEVAAAVISNEKGNNLERIQKGIKKLKGSFAFAIMFDNEKNIIYAARRGSPLVILNSEDGNYIASDIQAYVDKANKYIILDENEIAKITKENVELYDTNLTKIEKTFELTDMKYEKQNIENFSCYMEKEIYEEPDVIANTLEYLSNIDLPILSNYDSINIVACGSAMHAGLIGKSLIEEYLDIPVTVEIASEFRYKKILLSKNALVIGVSQSGETADTLAALEAAKKASIHTLSIVNVKNSSIARMTDDVICTVAGSEISVATTKAYLAQVATFTYLVIHELEKKDKVLSAKLLKEFKNIPEKINEILSKKDEIKKIAETIYNKKDIFFIGRNIDSALCMEGSLKLKEISYIHSESYSAGELKHGTISLITKDTPVITICTDNNISTKTFSNMVECKARDAFCILITSKKTSCSAATADMEFILPETTIDIFNALLCPVCLQLLAFYVASYKGLDIDKPRNLAKSVTVE